VGQLDKAVLKISHISKTFGKSEILKDINLKFYPGEIFGLIGASASGKTTLLRTIIGFLEPEKGKVFFRKEHLLSHENGSEKFKEVLKDPAGIKEIVGFASQTPSFYEELTLKENLEYFGSLYNLKKESIASNLKTLLGLMNLEDSINLKASQLSGGMKRRLDMACALIHDPQVLILDEPTSDLDPILRKHVWELVRKINKKGTTIIIASHNLKEIEEICDRIAIIKDHRVLKVGTTEEIREEFSEAEEIHLESFPGNYEKIMELPSKYRKQIINTEQKATEFIIYTKKPEYILHELLHKIEKEKETIIQLKVKKPDLDEIFVSLSANK
jgi:ABC-2 type transport system ATP-binding protein